MNRRFYFIVLGCLLSLVVLGQPSKRTFVNGFYILQDSGIVKKNDCVFCNPETMPDRIVLDSNLKMVARKMSNPMGYTYYEWRNKQHTKTYEEIFLHKYDFLKSTYYTDSGSFSPPNKNKHLSSWVHYSLASYNNKQPFNGVWKAIRVETELSHHASDSVFNLYKIPKDQITKGTKIWDVLNFNESGTIKSYGLIVTGVKEKDANKEGVIALPANARRPIIQYKIGVWHYCGDKGQKTFKENISTMRKEPSTR